MNDFKNAYQSAVQDVDMPGMNEIHIDAFQCMDESRHRRRVMKRMRRTMTTTFSTMCIIFVCGLGTVKAAEYFENIIRVNEWGFESADAVTMARNDAKGPQVYIMEDEVEMAAVSEERAEKETEPILLPEQEVQNQTIDAESVQNEDASMKPQVEVKQSEGSEGTTVDVAETPMEDATALVTDLPGEKPIEDTMQVTIETMTPEGNKEIQAMSADPIQEYAANSEGIEEVEIEEIPMKNYVSWEEFHKNEVILFPQPTVAIGKQITATDISVCGDWAMVRYDVDGKVLLMERTDYTNTQGHISSKVFPSGVCNERTYTTPAGYTYTLIDSVKESQNELLQIHAAITVGSYEAYIDFMGYTEEDAKKIIDSIDLSVYE